jgi:hypothetical protein
MQIKKCKHLNNPTCEVIEFGRVYVKDTMILYCVECKEQAEQLARELAGIKNAFSELKYDSEYNR